jgi:glutaredoxin
MITFTLYKKDGCLGCKRAEELIKSYPVILKAYDVENLHKLPIDEGREVQADIQMMGGITVFPRIIAQDHTGAPLREWDGQVPTIKEIEGLVSDQ